MSTSGTVRYKRLPEAKSPNPQLEEELHTSYVLAKQLPDESRIQSAIAFLKDYASTLAPDDIDLAYAIVERIEELQSEAPTQV